MVTQGGSEVADYSERLFCDKNQCSSNWNQGDDNILCSGASTYTAEIVISDEDWKKSATFEIKGRIADGPKG